MLLNSKHFCKLTTEENTAVLEKCPESYVAFKHSSFELFFLSRICLLHKFCYPVLKMRLSHISPQIIWLLFPFPLIQFSVLIFQNSEIIWIFLFKHIFWIMMSSKCMVRIRALLNISQPQWICFHKIFLIQRFKDLPCQGRFLFLEQALCPPLLGFTFIKVWLYSVV